MQQAIAENPITMAGFTSMVYAWVALGLLITTGVTFATLNHAPLMESAAQYVIPLILLELAVVFGMCMIVERVGVPILFGMFALYSMLNGLVFPLVLVHYTAGSVATTFMVCLATFTLMSVYGLVTKKDLSGLGPYLFMGLLGLIVVYLANIVAMSFGAGFITGTMDLILAGIGVIVFVGFTAYDSQRIKTTYHQLGTSESLIKISLMLGLSLYLNFVNLFLDLLRFFGEDSD